MSDRSGDGTPGFLRLDEEADRRAFRHWFTFLAESQCYRQPGRLPREINDCAALIRFAYRQALREHDGAWASELDLDAIPNKASVLKFTYPRTPLGAGLFRVRPGPFIPANLTDGAFAQFADAQTLQQLNTYRVTRDIRLAQPGDLLFYRQLEQNLPFHAMLYLGRSHFETSGANWIVYHTGPLGGGPGEIRRPAVEELLRHPSPRWRPAVGNGNFLGVYRWNILRDPEQPVALPAYSQGRRIYRCSGGVSRHVLDAGHKGQVVIVNDGSSDGTARVIREWSAKIPIDVIEYPRNLG